MKSSKESDSNELSHSAVLCERKQGVAMRGTPLRFGPKIIAFELYHPEVVLQVSDVLSRFTVIIKGVTIYSGKAIVRSVVQTEGTLICEANLDSSWLPHPSTASVSGQNIGKCFQAFLREQAKLSRIRPEYKAIIADLHTWLAEMRLWLGQVELAMGSSGRAGLNGASIEIPQRLLQAALPTMDELFDRFEAISEEVDDELRPAHQAFAQRQLHPFLLCSPFLYRTYAKPLGFAGDYEMINMIIRHRPAGNSFFAKLLDGFLLDQAPPRAVRSRVGYLTQNIVDETHRVSLLGRRANIYSLGCGPAREVESFVSNHLLANRAEFRLLDFNDETLRYVADWVSKVSNPSFDKGAVKLVKNSVQTLLKSSGRSAADEPRYDLIYCSGLYDYLSDRVCLTLNNYLYDRLAVGGKLVIGNFAPWTPRQHLMEDLAEWFLIYRDVKEIEALAPESAPEEACKVWAEPTGANIFLEVRKSQ